VGDTTGAPLDQDEVWRAIDAQRLSLAEIRGMVGSRRHNFGVTYRETLIDIG